MKSVARECSDAERTWLSPSLPTTAGAAYLRLLFSSLLSSPHHSEGNGLLTAWWRRRPSAHAPDVPSRRVYWLQQAQLFTWLHTTFRLILGCVIYGSNIGNAPVMTHRTTLILTSFFKYLLQTTCRFSWCHTLVRVQ